MSRPETSRRLYAHPNQSRRMLIRDGNSRRMYPDYFDPDPPAPVHNYLRFESDSPRQITPKYTNSGVTLQYSIDNGVTWIEAPHNVRTPIASSIWFRGRATGTKSLYTTNDVSNAWATTDAPANHLHVYGNIMYLLCDNFGDEEVGSAVDEFAFNLMFYSVNCMVTAPEIHVKTPAARCFEQMFMYCARLTEIKLFYEGNNSTYTTNWLSQVKSVGVLYKAGQQFTTQDNNTYPATWTQVQI